MSASFLSAGSCREKAGAPKLRSAAFICLPFHRCSPAEQQAAGARARQPSPV
jgi:hypothetical protein